MPLSAGVGGVRKRGREKKRRRTIAVRRRKGVRKIVRGAFSERVAKIRIVVPDEDKSAAGLLFARNLQR